jgi:hypothetical protein
LEIEGIYDGQEELKPGQDRISEPTREASLIIEEESALKKAELERYDAESKFIQEDGKDIIQNLEFTKNYEPKLIESIKDLRICFTKKEVELNESNENESKVK